MGGVTCRLALSPVKGRSIPGERLTILVNDTSSSFCWFLQNRAKQGCFGLWCCERVGGSDGGKIIIETNDLWKK